MPTMQQTFDKVVNALRKQGEKSLGSDGRCAYRSPTGLRCAAGHLIPDAEYSPDMEGKAVLFSSEFDFTTLPTDCIKRHGHELRLVARLQGVHDMCPVSSWEDRWSEIALEFGLLMPGKKGI